MTRFATFAVMLATASISFAQTPTTAPADVLKPAQAGEVETTKPLPPGETPDGAKKDGDAVVAEIIRAHQDNQNAARRVVIRVNGGEAGADHLVIDGNRLQANGDVVVRALAGANAEMEKCAFMGVSTSPIQPAARAQIDMPKGVGLVVDFVEQDSPAAKAGVQQHDIIHKLDDQLIINPQQLSVLVRTHKAGDVITLTVLRKNKPEQLKITLAEKMLPPLDAMAPVQFGMPQMNALRVMPALPDAVKLDLPPEILKRLNAVGGNHNVRVMTSSDGTHTVSITAQDGKKTATIKDKDGKTLFEGPLDTDADRAKVPAELREKLEKLEASATPDAALENAEPAAPATPPADVKPLPGAEPR